MAGIPIDIKEIYDAGAQSTEDRNAPVRVAILVDVTAPELLVDLIKAAFVPCASNALLHVESFTDTLPLVDSSADLVVVLGGDCSCLGEMVDSLRIGGLAVVVASVDMAYTSSLADTSGFPIPLVDIIAPRGGVLEDIDVQRDFLNRLGDWIVDRCKDKRLAFANAFSFIRRPLGLELAKATAFQNGVLGAVIIIPGADMPIMTLNQGKMVLQIAAAYGQNLGIERIKELAVVVGGGFAFRTVARQLVGLVPAAGWAIKAGIGYTGTIAMGYAAVEYFESGGRIEGLGEKLVKAREQAVASASCIRKKHVAARTRRRGKKDRLEVEPVSVINIEECKPQLNEG